MRYLLFISLFIISNNLLAQRLVTIGPAITEIVIALGAEQQIVATDNSSQLSKDNSAAKLGYIRQLPIEGILALSPDLIIASDEMAPTSTIDMLRQAGVKISLLSDSVQTDKLSVKIDHIAQLINSPITGADLKVKTQQQLDQLHAEANKIAQQAKVPRVIFLLSHEGRSMMAAGTGSVADVLITLSGAINPAKALHNYQTISEESLLEMQPDLILISARHGESGIKNIFDQYPSLLATPAGKNRAMMLINGKALLGGVGLSTLNEALHLQRKLQKMGNQ